LSDKIVALVLMKE